MYSFYLGDMLLPVTPSKLTLKIKGNNKTLSLANESEINFLRSPGLTEISFDMTLPMYYKYSFAQDYKRPDYYLSKLEELMTSKAPFRFIVSRISPSGALLYDNNMQVSLEDYNVIEDASKGPDVTISVSLKQYIAFSTKTGTVVAAETESESDTLILNESQRDTSSAPNASTYKTEVNDTLYTIAKKTLGSGLLAPTLLRKNSALLTNIWQVPKGVTLKLK